MKVPRVLVISSKYPPEYAGSGLRAHRTFKRLKGKGVVDFSVLCGAVEENTSRDYIHEDVAVTQIAAKPFPQQTRKKFDGDSLGSKLALRVNYGVEAYQTWKWLSRHAGTFDLFHVFGNASITSAAISFASAHSIPLIVEITLDVTPRQYKPFYMHFIDGTSFTGYPSWTRFVCISERLAKNCRDFGIDDYIWTRPNPVPTERFYVDRGRRLNLRARWTPFCSDDCVIVNVTKFMPVKNQTFLVDVLRHLPAKYKLLLAGPVDTTGPDHDRYGTYLSDLKTKVTGYGLQSRVCVQEGFIDHVDELLKAADIYAFPSIYEGLGTPMIEAMCCGLPVVAHRIEGITDSWVEEGVSGYLSSLDAKEFAAKIECAAGIAPSVLDAFAVSVAARASTEVIDKKYGELFQEVLNIK